MNISYSSTLHSRSEIIHVLYDQSSRTQAKLEQKTNGVSKLQWVFAGCVFLGCIVFAGCGLSSVFVSQVDKAIAAVNDTRDKLIQHGDDWQRLIKGLNEDLQHFSDGTVRKASDEARKIMQEGIQLSGQEINCRVDIIDTHIERRLDQVLHILKKDYHQTVLPPQVCTITPPSIDLGLTAQTELSISGAFFFNGPKPTIQIQNVDESTKPVSGDLVSRVTNYEMRVDLNELKRNGLLGLTAKRVLVTAEGSSIANEIPVVQAPSCSDHIKNEDETDIDCGGKLCAVCQNRQVCSVNSDCAGAACINGRCGYHQIGGMVSPYPDYGGGGGGNLVQDSECPTGSVAVGVFARTGNYMDSIGVVCAPLLPSGVISGAGTFANRVSDAGGNIDHISMCPLGRALRGLVGHTGAYVDEIKGQCSFPQDIALQVLPLDTAISSAITAESGGNPASVECGSGQAMVGLRARSGAYLDHLNIICAAIQRVAP